ncbi:MAG: flagellar biosynthetic protein FliR [Janthinobacterium lividum]
MGQENTWVMGEFFGYFMVFARLGGFIYMMPGISEIYVSGRVRLLFAMTLTLAITPVVQETLPLMPSTSLGFGFMILGEAAIGLIASVAIKIMLSTLDMVGILYGYQIGLANAFAFSPATSQQTGLPGVFLGTVAMVLIFAFDLHHSFLRALVESYQTFSPINPLSFAQLSTGFMHLCLQTVTLSFSLALQLSGPVIIFGFFMMMASGLLGRLVPQLQIFFVLQPLQLFLGFGLLIVSFALMMRHFFESFGQVVVQLWGH